MDWDDRFGYGQIATYPFDRYRLSTNLRTVSPSINGSLRILAIDIFDSTRSFIAHVDKIIETLSRERDPITSEFIHSYTVLTTFKRVPLVQVFVVVLFVASWVLTFIVVYTTARAWISQRDEDLAESALYLPVSAVLTVPGFRALWAGAPPFGILLGTSVSPLSLSGNRHLDLIMIDMCGVVPQMVIFTLCMFSITWRRSSNPSGRNVQNPQFPVTSPSTRSSATLRMQSHDATRRLQPPIAASASHRAVPLQGRQGSVVLDIQRLL